MKIALYNGHGGLDLQTIPAPKLVTGGALARIRACGIAISDLRAYTERLAPRFDHKLSGEIVQVSPKTSGIEVGTRIYIRGYYNCAECSACRRGFPSLCRKRTSLYDNNQAFSEYVLLPPKFLQTGGATMVGKNVSFEDTTHVGPLSNCLNTLRAVDFVPGDRTVILGAGPMGLLHLLLLKAAGATMVIVLDVDDYRLKKALELGAHHTVNSGRTDAIAEVQRLTDGGSDIVIVATGRADAMLSSIKMVRSRGRIDLFGGTDLEPGDTAFNLDPKPVHYNELRIIGTYGSLLNDYKKAAELITSKKISPSCLDTHYFDIDHLQDAISAAKDPKALRVVIRL